jgi:hypothetical protein
MARCSFETANFFFPLTSEPLDVDPDRKTTDVHASAASISYGEQNSTIARQLAIERSGFGVVVSATLQKRVPAYFL